jgi:anti-sigma factor RsiW
MKPDCEPFFSSLSPFVDGELAPGERMRVEQHLASCGDCTGRVADLRGESGLLRVGMEMLTDEVDFSGFSQAVMAKIGPAKLPLLERLNLSWSERFTYQRGMILGALGAAAALAVVTTIGISGGAGPAGYANERMALHSVTTDDEAHVAPVVMQTESGDSIIWVVDHAHVQVPDASVPQKEVDSGAAIGHNGAEQPKGGSL